MKLLAITYFRRHKGLLLLAALAIGVMAAVLPVDQTITLGLYHHRWSTFSQWMSRSLFAGNAPGFNDAVVLYLLVAVGVYALGQRRRATRSSALRPFGGFILTSALTAGIYLVHSLKWIVGRARPGEVLHDGLPFTHWFAFGPHFVTEGIYHGSFPSGHTAQMFMLMTMAYLLAGDPHHSFRVKVAGWAMGFAALGLSLAMAVARCMTLSHWISDGLGAIVFGWPIMHWIYHDVLRIPRQRRFYRLSRHPLNLPPYWEVVLCVHMLVGVLGIMMVLIGTRALLIDDGPWLVLMVPLGAALVWIARQRSALLLARVWDAYESQTGNVS